MARRSKIPKTPQEQVIHPDDVLEEEELNEGAVEQPSKRDVAPAANGTVLHLGSDLPDAPADVWNEPLSSPARRDVTTIASMGNDQSRETNTALHQTSEQLLTGKDDGRRKTTGKLQSLSTRNTNPAYKNPVANQRKLSAQSKVRKDVYDLGDSPVKLPPGRRVTEPPPSRFSPRRADRKRSTVTNEQPQHPPTKEARHESVSPRKSRRQQGLAEEIPETIPTPGASRSQAATTGEEEADRNVKFKTWFREVPIQKDGDTATGAGTGDDIGENITVAELPEIVEDAGAPAEPEEAQPRPKGRPKKVSTEKPPKVKKRRGRPPKESTEKKASKSPGPSKPSRETAVEGLRRRRTEGTGEDHEQQQPASPDGSEYAPEENDIDQILQEQPRATLQPKKARVSQVFPRSKSGADIFSSDPPDEDHASERTTRKRRRGPASSAQANTARKRRQAGMGIKDGRGEEDVEDAAVQVRVANGNAAPQRLFGQYSSMQKIFKNLDDVGRNIIEGKKQKRNQIELEDKDVAMIVMLCEEAGERFSTLRQQAGEVDSESDPATVLGEIAERVDGLRGKNEEHPTDFANEKKCTDIYAHLIPKLVELVWDAITCYLDMDKDEVPAGQIKIGHLRIVNQIIGLTLQLEEAAQKYVRPDPDYRIVRPVHNGIAVPLRNVREAFRSVIQKHEYGIQETRKQQVEANQRALQLEREEQELKQREEDRKLDLKWKGLHDERSWAEGGIPTARKLEHLQISSNLPIEYDQNGRAFSREEAFGPRIGPTPDKVDEAAAHEWSLEELTALLDGLRQYSGPRVFEKTFRRYCGVGKELNRFNVTEIVVTAAILRESLIASQKKDEERRGVVEEWILDVPVWIRGHKALGKENEDGAVALTVET